jgi:hypothetical protein
MAELVKKFVMTDGKASWRKILLVFMVPVTMFVLSTAYARYSWMRDQCYKVATNEKSLLQTKESLLAKDKWLEVKIDKNNGILHGRLNKEQDKREKSDDRMEDMIFKMLQQQQKQVEIQQEGLHKQEQFYQEQRTNGNK